MNTVTIIPVRGNALYRRYSGQNAPQDCYVSLDCQKGYLTADFNPEIGNALPFAVYHGHVQRWSIPALKADVVNALLREIAPLAERMIAGYERVWDGHNHVAEFSEDADEADDAIIALCDRATADADEHSTVQVWDASDWFLGINDAKVQCEAFGITAETTDDELRTIADAAEVEAADNGVDVLNGTLRHMEWLREKAIDAAD
jgi:hypothetical protein